MFRKPSKAVEQGSNSTAFLDLVRALAANFVLYGHAMDVFNIPSRIPAGMFGVSVFFILSGFLIMLSSLGRIQRPGPYFVPYMIDRFARIFTGYVPVLILVTVVNSLVNLGHWGQGGTSTGPVAFAGNLLLLQDYPLFQVVRRLAGDAFYIRPYNTAEPFWTIPIEFWIYVVFGLGFFGLLMRERLGGVLPAVAGLIALPVVIWNASAGGGNGLSIVWFVGAAAAYIWVSAWRQSARKLQIGLVVSLVAFICLFGRGLKIGWNFQDLGIVMCETLLFLGILSLVEGCRLWPSRLRVVFTAFASYSYSLYLAHNTVLVVMQKLLSSTLGRAHPAIGSPGGTHRCLRPVSVVRAALSPGWRVAEAGDRPISIVPSSSLTNWTGGCSACACPAARPSRTHHR